LDLSLLNLRRSWLEPIAIDKNDVINQNGDVYEIDKTNKDYRKKKLFKAA